MQTNINNVFGVKLFNYGCLGWNNFYAYSQYIKSIFKNFQLGNDVSDWNENWTLVN